MLSAKRFLQITVCTSYISPFFSKLRSIIPISMKWKKKVSVYFLFLKKEWLLYSSPKINHWLVTIAGSSQITMCYVYAHIGPQINTRCLVLLPYRNAGIQQSDHFQWVGQQLQLPYLPFGWGTEQAVCWSKGSHIFIQPG